MGSSKAELVERATELIDINEYIGICVNCGHEAEGIEPDARGDRCEQCGEPDVYGIEEILLDFGGGV